MFDDIQNKLHNDDINEQEKQKYHNQKGFGRKRIYICNLFAKQQRNIEDEEEKGGNNHHSY